MANYTGGSGDDIYSGTTGSDTASGEGGRDTLDGGAGDDTLYSGPRSPTWSHSYYYITPTVPLLDTGSEVDTLRGGAGFDTLFAGYGDNVDGGSDGARLLISFQGASAGVTANFANLANNGSMVIGGGTITNISSLAWIDGSNFGDTITVGNGSYDAPDIRGLGGNDTLIAGYSNGNLYGGDGNDVLDGRQSSYGGYYFGEAGDDTFYTSVLSSSAYGGDGNDTFNGAGYFYGGAGNDTFNLAGDVYQRPVFGDEGNDLFNGSDSPDSMYGGAGSDTLNGAGGNDGLYSAGVTSAGGGIDEVDRGVEHDELSGGAGDDVVSIGYGDKADGGTGTDTLILSLIGATSGVTFDANSMSASVTVGGGTISNFEKLYRVYGSAFADIISVGTQDSTVTVEGADGDDQLKGQGSAVILYGGAGNDSLIGGTDNDVLYGGTGGDVLLGGGGDDIIYVLNGDTVAGETINGGDGNDTLRTSQDYNDGFVRDLTGINISNVEILNAGSVKLTGAQLALFKIFEVSTLTIATGGSVSMAGKTFSWGPAITLSDTATVLDMTGVVTGPYWYSQQFIINGGAGQDVITTSGESNTVFGGGGNDTINAGAGSDRLYGGIGADAISAGAGDDTIFLLAGEAVAGETVNGGDGTDTVKTNDNYNYSEVDLSGVAFTNVEKLDGGSVRMTVAQLGAFNSFQVSTLTLTTGGNVALAGKSLNAGANIVLAADPTVFNMTGSSVVGSYYYSQTTITGGAGQDVITTTDDAITVYGGGGSDAIQSGAGNDRLFGGAGADTISAGAGDDTIFVLLGDGAAGETINGGIGVDTVKTYDSYSNGDVDLSDISFSNVERLETSAVKMTAAQVGAFGTFQVSTLKLTTGGTVSLAGKSFNAGVTFTLAADATVFNMTGATIVESYYSYQTVVNGGAGQDVITTLGGNDVIYGGAGGDTISAGGGSDSIYGGVGADIISAGAGDDTIYLASSEIVAGEAIDGGEGFDTVRIDNAYSFTEVDLTGESFSNVEKLIAGSVKLSAAQFATFSSFETGNIILTTGGTVSLSGKTFAQSVNITLSDTATVLDLTGIASSGYAPSTTIKGGAGQDTITTLGLSDTINAGGGDDTINSGAGLDMLYGGAGRDTFHAGDGDDRIFVLAGDYVAGEIYDGGAGFDLLAVANGTDLSASTLTSIERLDVAPGGSTSLTGAQLQGLTMLTVDGYGGGFGTQTLNLTTGGTVAFSGIAYAPIFNLAAMSTIFDLSGLTNAFAATVNGNIGNDAITGSQFGDTLNGGTGADHLTGGLGNDNYVVDSLSDTVVENANQGTDRILSSVSWTLGANLENLTLTGTAAIDGTGNDVSNQITGNAAANVLDGRGGADAMAGGAGDDTYVVDNVGDTITENFGEGYDLVTSTLSWTLGANIDDLELLGIAAINGVGNALDNFMYGNVAVNNLSGLAGDDLLDGGAGADVLVGGTGNDYYYVDNSGDLLVENANEGTDQVESTVSWELGANLENLFLAGSDAINGTGNALNNAIFGNKGANILDGGAGSDFLAGEGGDDNYLIDNSGDTVVEDANEGFDRVASTISYTLSANVEGLTLGGAAAVNGTGNVLDNIIIGNSANNVLDGGLGADELRGDRGNDTYLVDNVGDKVIEDANAGVDLILASVDLSMPGNVENATLVNTGANVTGNALSNLITGNELDNMLDGGAGADIMSGGLGSDTYIVDDANDLIIENSAQGALDRILVFTGSGLAQYDLSQSAEIEFLVGYDAASTDALDLTGNDLSQTIAGTEGLNRLYGLGGNDVLSGNGGTDWLYGGLGADALNGGNGDDMLTGGTGNDRIAGGAGFDTAMFSGSRDQYTIQANGDGTMQVTGLDGSDKISGVERYQFADTSIRLFNFAAAGDVLVSNFAVGAGGWTSQDVYPRHVADVNGDGYSDIVGFGQAGVFVAFGAANGGFGEAGMVVGNFGQAAGWSSDNAFHRALADVNGDGRADIVGFGSAGTWVSLALANGSFNDPTLGVDNFGASQGWTSQDGFARTVGDVNGDGKADLVGFGQAGTWVALGKGDGSFDNAALAVGNFGVAQGWSSDNSYHRVVADVNGDGKDDIVGFGQPGVLVSLSNGDGTFAEAQFALGNFGRDQGWSSQDGFARVVGDINSDGRADIVGFGASTSWIAFGQANGTFATAIDDVANFSQAQGWSSDTSYHRELADINRDGHLDIVGFGHDGVLAGLNLGDYWIV